MDQFLWHPKLDLVHPTELSNEEQNCCANLIVEQARIESESNFLVFLKKGYRLKVDFVFDYNKTNGKVDDR